MLENTQNSAEYHPVRRLFHSLFFAFNLTRLTTILSILSLCDSSRNRTAKLARPGRNYALPIRNRDTSFVAARIPCAPTVRKTGTIRSFRLAEPSLLRKREFLCSQVVLIYAGVAEGG